MLHWYHICGHTVHPPIARLGHCETDAFLSEAKNTTNLGNDSRHRRHLIPVHGHPLAVPAELAVGSGGDGARAVAAGRGLLQSQQLLGAEGLVVNLCGGFDEVLQVRAGEEVAEVDEFAVVLVLDWVGLEKCILQT